MASVESEAVESISISRGAQPDLVLNFDKIENLLVYNEQGEQIRVGDIYKNQKTILILVRHFLCFICKEYVDDLAMIPPENLKAANVQLVVIGCGKAKFIEPFRRATAFNYALYVDPDRELYKALSCREKLNFKESLKASKHVKSGFVSGVFKSIWRGMPYREMQGDVDQQGAAFIVGPGNAVHFVHYDAASTDHAPINDLLAAAGVDQVSFEKDQRVITI